ncbi:MAG: hypothetical protein HY717_21340 [Planctomycetes bacterium]|nr:hypothetical protein [Planctomycetota bacterium]
MPSPSPIQTLLGLLLGLALASCSATYSGKLAPVREAYFAANLTAAQAELQGIIEDEGEGSKERDCLLLEEGLLQLASGDSKAAEETLLRVRDSFDALETRRAKEVMSNILSYFADDRSTVYGGEDYEKIMIRVLLAFASLMHGGADVIAYTNQILEKQRAILDELSPDRSGRKYKDKYKKIGAGAYLYGIVTEDRDPTASSEVKISFGRVKEWEPQFTSIDADLERVEKGVHSQPGNGVLYVFTFVGRGPDKVEVEEADLTFASEIALQFTRFIPVLRHFGPTLDLSPLKTWRLRPSLNNIAAIEVTVDGHAAGATETLTDVTLTAIQQYNAVKDWVLAKAILRRMLKKAVVTAAKGAGRMAVDKTKRKEKRDEAWAHLLIELGGIAANTIWSAVERADTRCWSLLPDKIQVCRVELPAGEYEVVLTPRFGAGLGGLPRLARVKVHANENTYILGFIPTPGPGPALFASEPAGPAPLVEQ